MHRAVGGNGDLIGRDLVLEDLERCLEENRSAVVSGPAGAGKTRLLAEIAVRSEADRRPVTLIRGSQAARSVALAPFLPLLPISGGPDRTAEQLYLAVLHHVASSGRSVVVIDDAHLLDDASAALAAALASHPGIVAVVAIRTGETIPRAIDSLLTDEVVDEVVVPPLVRPDVDALVEAVLGPSIAEPVLGEIWRLSEGLPLFVHELLFAARERGSLRIRDGSWELTSPLSPSGRLSELVEERLCSVRGEALDLLGMLALSSTLDRALAELIADPATILELLRRELIAERSAGRRHELAIGHPLYGEIIDRHLTRADRRHLLLRQVEFIEQQGARRRGDAIAVLTPRLELGDRVSAQQVVRAALEALSLNDYALAITLTEAVQVEPPDAAVLAARARALAGERRFDEADLLYERVLELVPDGDDAAAVHVARASIAFELRMEPASARLHLDRAAGSAATEAARSRIALISSVFSFVSGPRLVERHLALVEDALLDPESRVDAAMAWSATHCFSGRLDRALEWAERCERRAAETSTTRWMTVERAATMEFTSVALRHPDAGLAIAEDYLSRVETAVDGLTLHLVAATHAALLAGRVETADRLVRRWRQVRPQSSDRMADGYGLGFEGLTAIARLDWARAEVALRELGDAPAALGDPLGGLVAGRLRAAGGEHSVGVAMLEQCADELVDRGLLVFAAHVARHLDTIGEHGRAVAVLDRFLALTDPDWVAVWWRDGADAARARDVPRLERIAERFASAGFRLDAATTWARAAIVAERPLDAIRLGLRARRQLATTGGGRCVVVDALPAPVTARELEVLVGVAGGAPNRVLAERLGIGRRTVENHLHRALNKLGATRADIVAELGTDATPRSLIAP